MPTKVIEFNMLPYQWEFYSAVNRFPGSIAGWGTGKTTIALLKGDLLSRFYKNNLGLIVRDKFTDLRDSTMKDFTKWTGKTVPQGTKEAKYANGSQILFRHAKDLSGLQNVNLGWAYIEQAEEFPTDTQFQLFRGRLRRELEVDEDYWNSLVESYDKADAELPAFLQHMHDNPVRQMFPIANANGHNWMWKMFVKSPQDGYTCMQAKSFDNPHLPKDFHDDLKRMEFDAPAKYKQYVMNCHDEVDLDACYYIEAMNNLRKNDHITSLSYNPAHRVNIVFDVGFDCTSIWFIQVIKGKRCIIDYYENTGKPIKHYTKVLDKKDYDYGRCVMPHDSNKREMVSGTTLSKAMKDFGYKVVSLKRETNLDVGINDVLNTLPSLYFDEKRCEAGLEALDHYRREYNDELKIYTEKPLHDWASHPADSMRYLCKALNGGLFSETATVTTTQINKWQKKYSRTG
jgi:hypothetical protein